MISKKIILGTVQMGLPYGVNNTSGKVSFKESQNILKKAHESGIRILDTAEAYGNAHQVIGDFHRANPDKIFRTITKIPDLDNYNNIEIKIIQYLHDLNVTQLEGVLFHAFKSYNNHREIIPLLKKLKSKGLFKQFGVSVYTNNEIQELIADEEIDFIQMPFNLLDNFSLRGEIIREAKKKGKIIHTRSVFLQGLFYKNPLDNHKVVQSIQNQLLKIHKIAKTHDISITSLALCYCLQQQNIDQILIGVDSLAQLISDLEAANNQIDEELIQTINQIKTNNIDLLNPSLWQ